MRIPRFIVCSLILISIYSCRSRSDQSTQQERIPKTPVTVVQVSHGAVNDELTLFGTTIYLKRNAVTAPIASYIKEVNVKLGDQVKEGQLLYVLQSKESRALGDDISKLDSSLTNFGIIRVKASATGIVSTLDKQQSGEYVLEGAQLCTIAESDNLVFQVNVPYEYSAMVKNGKFCTIVLPDTSSHQAVFTKALTAMNVQAQTQTILAKSVKSLFLPENMIVKVLISKCSDTEKQLLPLSAVASDEMLKNFWIMKLINDSTAIRQNVTIGNKNSEWIEILSPQLSTNELFISAGNFGLADTALVTVKR